jgi:hypothetical protein
MLNNSNFGQNKTREHIDFLVDKRSFSKEEYEKILELALIGNLSEDVFFEFVNC